MPRLGLVPLALPALFAIVNGAIGSSPRCRSQPGDSLFPTQWQLAQFNVSIEGRLMRVVPSGQFCKDLPGGCLDSQWTDALFRNEIPGAVLQDNWEQDYTSNPPSLCFRNSSVCGQGSVPIYGINATEAAHIQAGVRFAQAHDLKVAIKASGHDYLGRSTAKNSLLLWTRYFKGITFHDSFIVGGKNQGSAVTVGSGVGLHNLYQAAKAKGKIFVGGSARTVVAAGGYVQGAGHSAISPTFGLAADNALEFQVVIADGSLVTSNEISHPDLFWALRGGGAGSWGVIISATFRTFPTFDVVHHQAIILVNTSEAVGQVATLHAQHIFDWDALRGGQYLYVSNDIRAGKYFHVPVPTPPRFAWSIITWFPNATLAAANASLAPFLDTVAAKGFSLTTSANVTNVNDALSTFGDGGGEEAIMGSRLVPADVYRHNAMAVGKAYQDIFDAGAPAIIGIRNIGGQVSKNAKVSNAINPKWRTAKTHLIIPMMWDDSTSADTVESIRQDLTHKKIPILDRLAGPGSGAYSNEADVREPDFRTVFFGPNYSRLSAIKRVYDPHALFIVGGGVGSEKWDAQGLCRVE